jgi:murein DD-endopeptidase MepM/ murein hydrolase activator NlpD
MARHRISRHRVSRHRSWRHRLARCVAALGALVLVTVLVAGTLTASFLISSLAWGGPTAAHAANPAEGRVAWQPPARGAVARGAVGALRPRSPYRWPLSPPPAVVRPFTPPPQPWLAGHRGVDLAAEPDDRVLAAGPGVVAFAGQVAGTPVVSIDHAGGLRTTYQPVTATVRAGQPVVAGDPIGVLVAGHPGCPVAACLHWGLRSGERYLDPLVLLGGGRIRLLPLDADIP